MPALSTILMSPLLLPIVKIIVFIFPFLNKGVLKGKWRAFYISQTKGTEQKILSEDLEVNQFSSITWGTIIPFEKGNDPTWKFVGLHRDQVFVGIYFAPIRLSHWQGSFTLYSKDPNPMVMNGYYSGFEEDSQKVIGSKYRIVRPGAPEIDLSDLKAEINECPK